MHPLPRQESSSGAAPNSSDTAAPTTASGSAAATGSQASASATVTVASSTTPATTSSSADPTASSSSTETTSTSSSSDSTSPSSTSASSTTTPHASPASSSSIASETTSPTSSYVSVFLTTAYSSPYSSSPPGTPTTITSTYTTFVNGSPLLTSTAIPSTIPAAQSALSSSSNRTAIVAGSAAGGTALIILVLSLAFCARRQRFKRLYFLDAITLRRRQARSRATLLDGEDLDPAPPSHRYTDYETAGDTTVTRTIAGGGVVGTGGGGIAPPGAPASRWSEAGSVFREDFWSPPHEGTGLMDPLAHRVDFDLGRIVDDVMGPPPTARHYSDNSVSTVHRGSVGDSEGMHSRTVSNSSNAALLEAAGLAGASTAPARPSPLVQQEARSESVEHHGEAM